MNPTLKPIEDKSLNPIILTLFIGMAMISRFVLPPFMGHPENFSPIDATALFAGAYFGRKWMAFLLPILSVWISDWIINYQYFHHWMFFYPGFYWQYGFYIGVVLFSAYFLKSKNKWRIMPSALLVSIAFFLVSNFGVWASFNTYPHTYAGLILCYTAGIPFFRSTLVSDLLYSIALFGFFEFLRYFQPAWVYQKPEAVKL